MIRREQTHHAPIHAPPSARQRVWTPERPRRCQGRGSGGTGQLGSSREKARTHVPSAMGPIPGRFERGPKIVCATASTPRSKSSSLVKSA